jgi:hypothetical protein
VERDIVEDATIPAPPDPAPSGVNRWLDRLTAPRTSFCGVAAPPYLVLGIAGIVVAFAILVGAGLSAGVPLSAQCALGTAALLVFVLAGKLRQRLGRAPHILLEDVTLVLLASAGVSYAFGLPVIAGLDRMVVALGGFLVLGRLGCLTSGCCHGRPAGVGVRYGADAVPAALVGVRLFPVPLVEAVWTAAITSIAGTFLGAAPGSALIFWLAAYGSARFVLELLPDPSA